MVEAELRAALDATYEVFATAKPRTIEGCPCCLDRKDVCTLLAKPLRELTADDLAPYAASIFLTVGDQADFRYFLPRILELSALEQEWWPSEEVVLNKLRLANWQGWPDVEKDAVSRLLGAWFDALLRADPPQGWTIDAVICGMGRAGIDPTPHLRRLAQPGHVAALASFHAENSDPRTGEIKLGNAFWQDAGDAGRPIVAFLEEPAIRQRIGDWLVSLQSKHE